MVYKVLEPLCAVHDHAEEAQVYILHVFFPCIKFTLELFLYHFFTDREALGSTAVGVWQRHPAGQSCVFYEKRRRTATVALYGLVKINSIINNCIYNNRRCGG